MRAHVCVCVFFYCMFLCVSNRAVYSVGLRPLACWDGVFESGLGHSCLSLVSAVCCQVEACATGCLLV
jgi:hypothetical protein